MGVIAQLRLPDIFLHYEPIIQQFRTLRPLKQGMSRSIPCMSVIQRYVGNGGISQISEYRLPSLSGQTDHSILPDWYSCNYNQ